MKTSKRWVLLFFVIFGIGLAAYAGLNFYANPLGYFTNARGIDYYYTNDYGRGIKTTYLLQHRDEIEGVIIGGSKAGSLNTDLLTECTGLSYYNLYANYGNFADYLRFTRFLAEQTDVKEITLHLSSYEVEAYDVSGRGNEYKVPAAILNSPWKRFTEFLSYLMPDYHTTLKALRERLKKNPLYADALGNGMKNRVSSMDAFHKNPDRYVRKNVVNTQVSRLRKLFLENENDETQRDVRAQNLQAMREIKQICDEHGITLKVMIGASFISEHYSYECEEYYDYLYQLVMIAGEVWDFSDFNDINLNPYNFVNGKHFNKAVADLMIHTIYGKEQHAGFGTLLTKDNVLSYAAKRRTDYLNKRGEYLMYGTVFLQNMDDESYIPLERYGY